MFLDRDGTLNADKGYVWRREDWAWIPGVPEALAALHSLGFLTIVVTNQSGVARGMYGEDDVRRLHDWAAQDAAARGGRLDAFYFCPHLEGCDCRKPLPGMLLKAAKEWGVDLSRSYMVGDRARDVEAGRAAGTFPIFLTASGVEPAPAGVAAAPDLRAACDIIRSRVI